MKPEVKSEQVEWVISPSPHEVVKSQTIKGQTTKSVGFSVVYPDGSTGYLIIGRVGNGAWQPFGDIADITIKWR